jgi:hypothetical protein
MVSDDHAPDRVAHTTGAHPEDTITTAIDSTEGLGITFKQPL